MVFACNDLLGLFYHLDFLFTATSHLLIALDLLITSLVLNISNFFLEVELVADKDVVKFLVFHSHVLHIVIVTFLLSSRALHFSSRDLIFLS